MVELLTDAELREAIRGVDLPRLQRATATARARGADAGLLKEAEARAAHLNASVAEAEKRVAADEQAAVPATTKVRDVIFAPRPSCAHK